MKKFGILKPSFENNYPKDWINPTIVEKTHPVFHVKANGDLVFHRPTRIEYARMMFQKRFPGKLGLQPWRWRAYLKKPEAPEKIRDWAKRQADKWAKKYMPKPVPAPAPVTGRTRVKIGSTQHVQKRRR